MPTARKVKSLIYRLNRGNIDNASILEKINKESALNLNIETKNYTRGDNKFIDSVNWKRGISKDLKNDNGDYVIINITEVLPASVMQFSDVKGKVISDYQKYLDDQWITFLRKKYNYSVNKDLLYTLIK